MAEEVLMSRNTLLKLSALGALTVMLVITGCERRKRLTGNDVAFRISPPAATAVKGSTVTLSVVAGSGEINPTWAVSGPGTLSPAVGRTVEFTSDQLGDAVVTATYDGAAASAQIAVVAYNPSAISSDRFDVYNEGFFEYEPALTGTGFLVFVGPDDETIAAQTTGYTPQGITYFRMTAINSGSNFAFWGVSVSGTKDLTAFATGNLKLAVRVAPQLGAGPNVRVEINDGSITRGVDLVNFGFSPLGADWQEITIPVGAFTGQGIALATIKNPFAIALQFIPAAATFTVDVDAVRWEK